MKLVELEPCWLDLYKRPRMGVAFNCPGDCCADRRQLQDEAAKLEAQGSPSAREARHKAFLNQPFRVWVAFKDAKDRARGGELEEFYERSGNDFESLSVSGNVDRTTVGHARIRIKNGKVTVL